MNMHAVPASAWAVLPYKLVRTHDTRLNILNIYALFQVGFCISSVMSVNYRLKLNLTIKI
jgi:hypothetical protein